MPSLFAEYLDGIGDRAIAAGLNRDGIPCPSANRPDQNRHRLADGWQASTVGSILQNPRYTGYVFFGRWTKHETLLDPDDVAAGHVVRFRRSTPDRVVRSRQPAHPEIVSVEDFTQAQLLRRSKGGPSTACKTERTRRATKRAYLFRGRIRCSVCTRKMEASPRKHAMYYRCPARTMAPGSPALANHPAAVYLREDPVRDRVNEWIGSLFTPENRDSTVKALIDSQTRPKRAGVDRELARKRLADAEARLARFTAAIKAGIDPAALVEETNQAQRDRAAAQAALNNTPDPDTITEAEVYAMIDSLGDVGAAIKGGKTESLAEIYEAANLEINYEPDTSTAEVRMRLTSRVNKSGVRGRSCTLFTRCALNG